MRTARYINRIDNKYSGYKHWMIENILVGEFMQSHMFRVSDDLLCRHGWSPSHSHLLTFSTVVSPWWPWLLNGVGQMKCGIWSNGGLVRMTSFPVRQDVSNSLETDGTFSVHTSSGRKNQGGEGSTLNFSYPLSILPFLFQFMHSVERWGPFGGRRGWSGRKP